MWIIPDVAALIGEEITGSPLSHLLVVKLLSAFKTGCVIVTVIFGFPLRLLLLAVWSSKLLIEWILIISQQFMTYVKAFYLTVIVVLE
jgi:hypothetical protein